MGSSVEGELRMSSPNIGFSGRPRPRPSLVPRRPMAAIMAMGLIQASTALLIPTQAHLSPPHPCPAAASPTETESTPKISTSGPRGNRRETWRESKGYVQI